MRRLAVAFAAFCALVASSSGCFHSLFETIPTGSFGCDVDDDCPDNYRCIETSCWRPGTGPDMASAPRDQSLSFGPEPDMAVTQDLAVSDLRPAPGCDIECGATRRCVGGACLLIVGQPCAQDAACASNMCSANFCD